METMVTEVPTAGGDLGSSLPEVLAGQANRDEYQNEKKHKKKKKKHKKHKHKHKHHRSDHYRESSDDEVAV